MIDFHAQAAPTFDQQHRVFWPHAFETDFALAQCFGAGGQLESLYNILQAAHAAARMCQEDPERVPELLAIINEQATKSYRELMCSVGWVGSNPPDATM